MEEGLVSLSLHTYLEAVNLNSLGHSQTSGMSRTLPYQTQAGNPYQKEALSSPRENLGQAEWKEPPAWSVENNWLWQRQSLGIPHQTGEPGIPSKIATERGQHSLHLPLTSLPKPVGTHSHTACFLCSVNTSMYLLYRRSIRTGKSMLGQLGYRKKYIYSWFHRKRRNTEISTWRAGTSVCFIYWNIDILHLGEGIMWCLWKGKSQILYEILSVKG